MLAGDWHNELLPTDVNADSRASPLDVLQAINKLASWQDLPILAAGETPTGFYDTTGDGQLTARDALVVINDIRRDLLGNVLTEITSVGAHSIQATFRSPVSGALLSPEAYILTAADSSRLKILSVAEGESPNQVLLTIRKGEGGNKPNLPPSFFLIVIRMQDVAIAAFHRPTNKTLVLLEDPGGARYHFASVLVQSAIDQVATDRENVT